MPSPDASRVALLASAVLLGVLLLAGLVLVGFLVDAPFRTAATRLVTAAVLALAALRVRALVHAGIARQPRSSFESARERRSDPGADRSRFEQLHDEVRYGARDRRYFEQVLWPRLCALAQAKTGEGVAELPKPRNRSFGRGPSLPALADLIAAIEARR